jgi:hypothetical protein
VSLKLAFYCDTRAATEQVTRLQEAGFDVVHVSRVSELFNTQNCDTAYHGLILCTVSYQRATTEIKATLDTFAKLFPTRYSVYDSDSKLRLFTKDLQEDIEAFFVCCDTFVARPIRRHPRTSAHLTAEISRDHEFKNAERTITFNLSQDGCFIFSSKDWAVNETLWIQFAHLADIPPIQSKIQWLAPWKKSKLPGFGVHFRYVTAQQKEALQKYLKMSKSYHEILQDTENATQPSVYQ